MEGKRERAPGFYFLCVMGVQLSVRPGRWLTSVQPGAVLLPGATGRVVPTYSLPHIRDQMQRREHAEVSYPRQTRQHRELSLNTVICCVAATVTSPVYFNVLVLFYSIRAC